MGPDDEGLAPERTALAWQRTGLAYVGAGVLLLRNLPITAAGWGLILIGVLGASAGFYEPEMRGPRAFRAVSLAMTALAVIGVLISLL